jgi:hypothetical protein
MRVVKSIVLSCLLVMAFAITGFAQTQVTQLPTSCIAGVQYQLSPAGGAYASQVPGLYTCLPGNVLALFGGGGSNTLAVVGADFTNATATAATVISYPVQANLNYQFSCTLFWQNSGTNAMTLTVTTPGSPTNVLAFSQVYSTNTGTNTSGVLTGSPLAFSGAAAGSGATTYKATIEGTLENGSTAGTLAFQASAGTGTTTIKRGSYCSARSLP